MYSVTVIDEQEYLTSQYSLNAPSDELAEPKFLMATRNSVESDLETTLPI